MSEGLNRVTLIGNLGQDPELRYTAKQVPVMSMRLATSETYMKDGEKRENTSWHRVVIWGKRAEGLDNCRLGKGARICIEGRLETRSWEKDDGSKQYSTEVVATNVVLLGGRRTERDDDATGNYDDAF